MCVDVRVYVFVYVLCQRCVFVSCFACVVCWCVFHVVLRLSSWVRVLFDVLASLLLLCVWLCVLYCSIGCASALFFCP